MCVVLYKPPGLCLPEVGVLRKMYKANDDGAGVMWVEKDWVCGSRFVGF